MRMMNMRGRLGSVAGLGALTLLASAGQLVAQAQPRTGSAFELGAGPMVGQGTGLGLHASAAYVTAPSNFGLGIRLEGIFNTWRARHFDVPTKGRVSMLGVSLVQTLSRGALQPYATGGVGGYAERGRGFGFALNAGAGLRFRLGSASLFTELRVHRVAGSDGRRLEPLTFGIRF